MENVSGEDAVSASFEHQNDDPGALHVSNIENRMSTVEPRLSIRMLAFKWGLPCIQAQPAGFLECQYLKLAHTFVHHA